MSDLLPEPAAAGPTDLPSGTGAITADDATGFGAVTAAVRATTDAVDQACRGVHTPTSGDAARTSRDQVAAATTTAEGGDHPRCLAALEVATASLERVERLHQLRASRRVRQLEPLTRLAATVAAAHWTATEAWVAAGPDGAAEAVLPPMLLDLPSELVRSTAELDEVAAARGRRDARYLLEATDVLVQLGRDAHRLSELLLG